MGMGLRVADNEAEKVLTELRKRELVSSAYLEKWIDLKLSDGRLVPAVTYVVDRNHPQYCQLELTHQAEIIAQAAGGRGANWEYLINTADLLKSLGIGDPELDWLVKEVTKLGYGT
jgi:cation transport protein ChaC